jgi:hypothetical protein
MERIFFCEYMHNSHFVGKEKPDLCGTQSSITVGNRNGGKWLKDVSVSSKVGARRKVRDLYRYKWRPTEKAKLKQQLKAAAECEYSRLQNVSTPHCSTAFWPFWASVLSCVLWNSEFFNKVFLLSHIFKPPSAIVLNMSLVTSLKCL